MHIDYEKQYEKIYRYCYYKLQQKEIAEDITQETFLRYLQNVKYQQTDQPLKIMYTIARNLCIDERRRKKAGYLEEGKDVPYEIKGRNMEEELLTSILLKTAMEKLKEEERDILFLRIVNEEPLSVIGKLFHISRYAVYRRCEHALQILRKEME